MNLKAGRGRLEHRKEFYLTLLFYFYLVSPGVVKIFFPSINYLLNYLPQSSVMAASLCERLLLESLSSDKNSIVSVWGFRSLLEFIQPVQMKGGVDSEV